MSCEEYRRGHPAPSDAARAHLEGCAECRSLDRAWQLLGAVPALEPSPGFYRGIRRKLSPAILRFAAPIAAAAAALLLALLLTHPTGSRPVAPKGSGAGVTEEERELVENLDLLENYELLRTLELVGENGSPLHEEKR